ncbi:MAG: helix-turn-helix transcriptional regulator [Sphingomonadales bacterium]|nr:helix-turn-helix transcriptional regulator [Sphingomonadales bacterium]
MDDEGIAFSTTVFSVDVAGLAVHANPVPNVIMGVRGSLTVVSATERVSGDILFIRPGVEHKVHCGPGGFTVVYLDGLHYPDTGPFARRLERDEEQIAVDTLLQKSGAVRELRMRLMPEPNSVPDRLVSIIADMISEPMTRMTQLELAERLQLERTTALRTFKAATGQTFRRFKQWSALQHAARLIAQGELVRTAAMDAGFADTAHLSRTFRASFGLSPAEAIAGQGRAASA